MKLIGSADVPLNSDTDKNLAIETMSQSNNPNKKDLLNGASIKLDNPILEGPRLIATLRTTADEYLRDGDPDYFTIIDLRGVSAVDGYKVFDGQKVHPSTQYLIIDPMQLDWDKGVGYKGVYSGDTIKIGRYDPTKELTADEKIKRDRFPGLGPWTSRNHFSISYDQDGSLIIQDLNSSNGTALAQGEGAIDLLIDGEHRRKIEDMIKPVGETAVESEVLSEATDAAKKILQEASLDNQSIIRITAELTDKTSPDINKSILENFPNLKPKYEFDVNGDKYLISPTIQDHNGRLHVIAYIKVEGSYYPRLFYKSNSEGGWRSCPGWIKDTDYRGYSKGFDDHFAGGWLKDELNKGGYVQYTKPVEILTQKLEDINNPDGLVRINKEEWNKLVSIFDLRSEDMQKVNTFGKEVKPVLIEGSLDGLYDCYGPGKGFLKPALEARSRLEKMQLPPGFEPDFSQEPIRSYTINHTIAKLTRVSVYKGVYLNRPIEWHVAEKVKLKAEDNEVVWIDSIRFADTQITSYGTPAEVILAGALNCKPFEYSRENQLEGMNPEEDYDFIYSEYGEKYVSMQKTIDRFPAIKRFKESMSKKK